MWADDVAKLRETAEDLTAIADDLDAEGRKQGDAKLMREGAAIALARAAQLEAEIARREGLS